MRCEIQERVRSFVAEQLGVRKERLRAESRLLEDFGADGDDFEELIEAFGREFEVDLTGYRWDRHHGPEGFVPSVPFRRPHREKATQIPITVSLLAEAAILGRWPVDYPPPPLEPKAGFVDALLRLLSCRLLNLALGLWAAA